MLMSCLVFWLLPLVPAAGAPLTTMPLPSHAAAQNNDVRPPVVTPQMRQYSRTRYALYFAGTAYEVIALWSVLASGLSARLRRLVQPLRFSFFQLFGYYALLTMALVTIHAPLTWYSGYYLEHAYGLSSQSVTGWLEDMRNRAGGGHCHHRSRSLAAFLADQALAAPVGLLVLGLAYSHHRLRHLRLAAGHRPAA